MKVAVQSTLILVLWIVFWLGGTVGGAVLQAWLVDIGVVSGINPPWIITIGSSFIGFFAGAYAAIKLGDLTPRKKDSPVCPRNRSNGPCRSWLISHQPGDHSDLMSSRPPSALCT